MDKNFFFVILAAVLLTTLLLAPGLVLNKCPLGLAEDNFPGNCPLYTDQNQDQFCDIVQSSFVAEIFQPVQPAQISFLGQFFQPEVLVVLGLLILGSSFLFIKKYLWLRYLSLLIGLIYLGFIKASLICPLLTFQLLFLIKSRIVLNLSVFLIFLLPIIFALLFGRIYCWWVCPLGAFQEFVYKVANKSRILSRIFTNFKNQFLFLSKIHTQCLYLKYFILIAIILAIVFFKKPILCGLEPFSALFCHWVTPISITALILLIILGIFIFRPWCQYLCPYGAILSLLAKIKIFKPKK